MKFLPSLKLSMLPLIFSALVIILAASLFSLEQGIMAYSGYATFLISVCVSYLTKNKRLKVIGAVVSVISIVAVGLIFPLDIEELEEVYLFIPFLYLIIFPGSWWPIPIGFLLVTAYLPSLGTTEIEDFIEDAMEMIVISGFATIMAYFQQKSFRQMKSFRHESVTDYLTRLPNRKKFMEHMEALHKQSLFAHDVNHFALLIIDLDGFKKINDQLGHLSGDQVLKMVATRLDKLTSENCQVFRIGGDEFALVVTCDHHLRESATKAAQGVIELSKTPYTLNDKNYLVSASIGISIYPDEAKDIEILCSNADMAMYAAKHNGKNCFKFFETELMAKTVRKYELDTDLKQAIARDELFLMFQPKVCLKTGTVNSAEALLRWKHPKHGLISPVEFIPIAEESDTIIDIGNWVLKQSCQYMVKWREKHDIERISVNVSSVQLADASFMPSVHQILALTECKPEWIEIEQTESWIMENPEENVRVLNELKDIGLYLSLDDFGTAYSSLSQVGRLPLDVLKIDKSFVDCCVDNTRDHMIVRTIIQLGQNLNMKIVAEGVEDEAQKQLLYDEGCDMYQGYLFSKPVTPEVFERSLLQSFKEKELG